MPEMIYNKLQLYTKLSSSIFHGTYSNNIRWLNIFHTDQPAIRVFWCNNRQHIILNIMYHNLEMHLSPPVMLLLLLYLRKLSRDHSERRMSTKSRLERWPWNHSQSSYSIDRTIRTVEVDFHPLYMWSDLRSRMLVWLDGTWCFLVFLTVLINITELSTGRMDPRVGSGRVGSRFCRILAGRVWSGQHFGFISLYKLLLCTWLDMNLRILHSDWLIFIDI